MCNEDRDIESWKYEDEADDLRAELTTLREQVATLTAQRDGWQRRAETSESDLHTALEHAVERGAMVAALKAERDAAAHREELLRKGLGYVVSQSRPAEDNRLYLSKLLWRIHGSARDTPARADAVGKEKPNG